MIFRHELLCALQSIHLHLNCPHQMVLFDHASIELYWTTYQHGLAPLHDANRYKVWNQTQTRLFALSADYERCEKPHPLSSLAKV